jgi:methyl-accepting chemotaxis protein
MFLKLNLARRLQCMAALIFLLVSFCVVVAAELQWEESAAAEAELEGLPAAASLLKLLKLSAEHRGLSAGHLSGNADFATPRDAKQREVQQALQDVEQALARYASPAVQELRQAISAAWSPLAAQVSARGLSGPESFARHNQLVRQQLRLLDEVVSASTLALDPMAQSRHLIIATLQAMPESAELVGQLRGFGSAMLGKPEFQASDRVFVARTLEQLQMQWDRVEVSLRRAGQTDPALAAQMASALQQARAELATAQRLVRAELLDAAAPALAARSYFDTLTRSIQAQHALASAAFGQLEQMLAERRAAAQRQMLLIGGIGALGVAAMTALMLNMIRSMRRSARLAIGTARAMAAGDFSAQPPVQGHDEFAAIVRSLDEARRGISAALGQVRLGVEAIAGASREIAQGSADLSRRTETQASALQQTAASMEQIAGTVAHSADSAQQAQTLAGDAQGTASRGGSVVREMLQTMQDIAESSRRIGTITGVIDGLAFQTNILALNAAVEAARAGEHGRGFAVVAAEVRQLAQRSAAAAREIKQMIASSAERVDAGGTLASSAGDRMQGIVEQVQRVSTLVSEIAGATAEQTRGIGQVNDAVAQLDQGTQQNSALAEESAAAAESLRQQSHRLAEAVARFRLAEA